MTDEDSIYVLIFTAKLISDFSGDKKRQFQLTYYLCDQTLQMFELAVPNSGFRPGKFLQRQRVKNSFTKKLLQPQDLYVGAQIGVCGRVFELIKAAQHSICLMEAYSDDFPESNTKVIIPILKKACDDKGENLRSLFQNKDTDNTGIINAQDAEEVLNNFIPEISKHAVLTLLRTFERDNETFDYSLLLDYLRV